MSLILVTNMSEENKITTEGATEPKQISLEVEGEDKEMAWTPAKKATIRFYEFTKLIAHSMNMAKDKTIEGIYLAFVPAEHPDRGHYDMGWRIVVCFEDSDEALLMNPTSAYAQAFLPDGPEDVWFQRLFNEINEKYAQGEIVTLTVPEKDVGPDDGGPEEGDEKNE